MTFACISTSAHILQHHCTHHIVPTTANIDDACRSHRASASVPCLVGTRQVPDYVDCVLKDILVVQITVPLPEGVGTVLECEGTVAVRRVAHSRPSRLASGAELAIVGIGGAETPWLVGGDSLVWGRAKPRGVSKRLVQPLNVPPITHCDVHCSALVHCVVLQ